MAPEQFLDGAITAATDQFGFCVSLWEALVGARPFAGNDLVTIRDNVVAGTISPPRRWWIATGLQCARAGPGPQALSGARVQP